MVQPPVDTVGIPAAFNFAAALAYYRISPKSRKSDFTPRGMRASVSGAVVPILDISKGDQKNKTQVHEL